MKIASFPYANIDRFEIDPLADRASIELLNSIDGAAWAKLDCRGIIASYISSARFDEDDLNSTIFVCDFEIVRSEGRDVNDRLQRSGFPVNYDMVRSNNREVYLITMQTGEFAAFLVSLTCKITISDSSQAT